MARTTNLMKLTTERRMMLTHSLEVQIRCLQTMGDLVNLTGAGSRDWQRVALLARKSTGSL